jgi:DNA-binding NtrC family response regulator
LVVTSEEEDIYIENGYFRENDVSSAKRPSPAAAHPGKLRDVLARVEEDCIRAAMDAADGRVSQAASMLGIHRSVLYRKLQAAPTADRPVADRPAADRPDSDRPAAN